MRIALPITLLLAVAALLLGIGFQQARQQVVLRDTWTPTRAKVTDARVAFSRIGGYRPLITYQYTAGGRTHEGQRFAPLPANGTRAWAEAQAARYDVGARPEVYVNPANPAEAFLHRGARFYPYALLLLGVLLVEVVIVLARVSGSLEAPPRAAAAPMRWYRLAPSITAQGAATASLLLAFTHIAITSGITAHYVLALGPELERIVWLAAPAIALGAIPGIRAWRQSKADHPFSTPVVDSMLAEGRLDMPLLVRMEMQARAPVDVVELRVSLVCLRRHGFTSQRIFMTTETPLLHRHLQRGDILAEECSFDVPHKKRRPTTPANGVSDEATDEAAEGAHAPTSRWTFPRIDWQIEVAAVSARGGEAIAVFPLVMRFPTEHEKAIDHRPRTAA